MRALPIGSSELKEIMSPDINEIVAILRRHWKMPSGLAPGDLNDEAFKIQVMIGQKYSHDNLKYQLGLIQTNKLKQVFDDEVCDRIAAELFQVANT